MEKEFELSKIIFREDLYPRIEKNPQIVQQYAENLDVLPPIEINQHNEIIDGWHRWTAYKKAGVNKIKVFITQTKSDTELLEIAIERNSKFGLQLSREDKKEMARRIYHITPDREREVKKKHLANILSVSERTIRDWLSRIDKDSKVARDKRIFNMWMACYTQEQIGEREGITKETVSQVCQNMADLPKSDKPHADHLIDFDPPIYNVWKFKEKSEGLDHFGNSEVGILDNLLYLYTKPFDVIIDPFAGSGSTINICKKRFRRYWVSDRKIIEEQKDNIRQWDMMDGLPSLHRWEDVRLIYLDPPYWRQSEGKYSKEKNDLANMVLDEFNKVLSGLIIGFSKKIKGYICLLMQPTQWNAPNKVFIDHLADMIRMVKIPIEMRIQCPYESQQANAQMVDWAKDNKKLLVLSRELIIWKI